MTADELVAWRKAHGLKSRQVLADLLPVPVGTLKGWETGRFAMPSFLPRALADLERELKRKN